MNVPVDTMFIKESFSVNKFNMHNTGLRIFLKIVAFSYNYLPWLRKYLKTSDGWINYKVGFMCKTTPMAQTIEFKKGQVLVQNGVSPKNDANWIFADAQSVKKLANGVPADAYSLMIQNKLLFDGDRTACVFMGHIIFQLLGGVYKVKFFFLKRAEKKERRQKYGRNKTAVSLKISDEVMSRRKYRMKGSKGSDRGVKYLNDPYLSEYSLDDFPRVKEINDIQMNTTPEISAERPELMTEWFRANGFEKDNNGKKWHPPLRQAKAFKHLMENKKPVIQKSNLIAGALAPEEIPVMVFPDTEGSNVLWAELSSIDNRVLNPHMISKENAKTLEDIFPYWKDKTIRNYVKNKYNYPLGLKIDDRTAVSFAMKLNTFSHTIPNMPKILKLGTSEIIEEIITRLGNDNNLSADQKSTLEAFKITLEGLEAYAYNLSEEASKLAQKERDPKRKAELENLAIICKTVPKHPATTLEEAFNSGWIFLVGILMENNNVSLSPGRLDQYFQPFFEADLAKIKSESARQEYIQKAIELASCFFLRIGHHQMALPDFANYLYSGTKTDSAVTFGGITPDGEDAVNDMTYIFLKVTEMLVNQEPNVNIRYCPGVNSDAYLKRCCEVNYIASGTPSMHNDAAMIPALEQHGFDIKDVRDWGATGCVEPTMSGKHTGHTNALCMNLVAGMEMALHNGYHPLLNWDFGPKTGDIDKGDFKTFDDFFNAYKEQMKFLIDALCDLNHKCGEAHAYIRPQPLLSSVTEGTVDKAMDNTMGGAKYNTSGSFNAGMADITDSMMAIKKLVFEEKAISLPGLKKAIDTNFESAPEILAMVKNKVPLFGSGQQEPVDMANKLTKMIFGLYEQHRNFRGGKYLTGYWTVSWHAVYGGLSNALPSGRLKGKAFTPGFTPQPHASKNILDNIRDMAKLDPLHMDNNVAFNIKFVPDVNDSREKTVDILFAYVKTYFKQGGMQLQLNMVSSDTLKDAMANPEHYKNLLVRISGYNALFVELTTELQVELIERAEFGA
ncbi:MAG: formate acetyltransferase [Proteobacteria bacterium]|nr:formate acetyltransferase [Pseudomonadota bacterium]